MGRRVPQGRDRIGILGGPLDSNPALSSTSAQYRVGTGHCLAAFTVKVGVTPGQSVAWFAIIAGGAKHLFFGAWNTSGCKAKLRLFLDGTSYYSDEIPDFIGSMKTVEFHLHRTGQVYFFCDGKGVGSADISAKAATDLDGTIMSVGARTNGGIVTDVLMRSRLFIFTGTFPTEAQRNAIVTENYITPDHENQTLVDFFGAGYAAARRADVPLNDIPNGSTTVTNLGTGGAFTISGGLQIQSVRTRAERVSWWVPRRTFFSLRPGYTGSAAAVDFGLALQPPVMRLLFGKVRHRPGGTYNLATINNVAVTSLLGLLGIASDPPSHAYFVVNSVYLAIPLFGDQLDGGDLWLIPNGTDCRLILNGQHVGQLTIAQAINLVGACTVSLDGRGACSRIAIWNPATVPATLEAEIRACCMNPDADPPSLMNKRVDFKLDSAHLPLATSTTVSNDGLGGGTLTLSAQRSTSCEVMLAGQNP